MHSAILSGFGISGKLKNSSIFAEKLHEVFEIIFEFLFVNLLNI